MGKLIVIGREKFKDILMKTKEMIEKDPLLKEQRQEMKNGFAEEKARRDAEYAAKQAGKEEKEGK